ncbi:MAG: Clp protease N-terminal domain-containing protein [Cyanobacteriota/Melainabacteria group bacterium]
MFERFTQKAILSIMHAQEEAKTMGVHEVGSEHLLLGLAAVEDSISAKALNSAGLDLETTRKHAAALNYEGTANQAQPEMPFTENSKRALEISWEEARIEEVNYIGSEHLLLGVLRLGEGKAAQMLAAHGTDIEALRSEVIKLRETETQ